MQLTQALTLVPERKREEEKTEDIGSARMSMDSIIDSLTSPVRDIPVIEFDLPKILSYYANKGKDDSEASDAMKGVRQFISDTWEDAGEDSAIGEMVEKIVGFAVRRVGFFIAKLIWGTLWRITKWLVREIVGLVVKNVLRWLIVPALEAVVGFLLTPVGLALGIVGGALAGAWLVYKAFFAKDMPKNLTQEQQYDDLGNPIESDTAGTAIAYGSPLSAGAPVSVAPSNMAPAKGLADLITRGESRAANPYVVVNMPNANHGRGGAGTRPLETMTVGQVLAAQAAGDFNAAGRYQIINTTLKGAVAALHLNGNELFDRNLQDKIFNEYLAGPKKRPHLYAYLNGLSDNVVAAALDASQEWASVAAPAGTRLRSGAIADGLTSYYDNSRNNHASIPAAQMIATLQQQRADRLAQNSTSVETQAVAMSPGITTAATKQNQVKDAAQAESGGTAYMPPQNDKTIIKTPSGQLVAANM